MKNFNVKRTFALAASALALSSAFVGCSDYSEFTEGLLNNLQNQKAYDEAFVEKFGQIDPNQDWGMNEDIGYIEAFSPMSTRAGVVEVNRNQWTEFDGENNKRDVTFPTYSNAPTKTVKVPNYRTSAYAYTFQIPGWPHLNGLYYRANGNMLEGSFTGDEIKTGNIPAGDITPFEIQYVSNWFRTHRNPESIELHLSDFFIQNVSCDFDQTQYLTTSTPLSVYNGWPETGNNGKNIATKEEATAMNNITTGTVNTGYGRGFDKDNNIVNYVDNLTENISYELDYLGFEDMAGNWTHVNNFNRGNSNFSPEDNESNQNREIKFVKSSGTENFHCRPSWGTGNQGDYSESSGYGDCIDSWVLVHLTWKETVKDTKSPYPVGTVIPREGYYLAFDFHAKKGNQVVNRDGYYSNWIIKITPANFTSDANSRRVFCEDLGGSLDFDFNDVVFDVAYEKLNNGNYQPIFNIQAAGGTMPIYIGSDGNEDYELHKMLGGASTSNPVNVGKDSYHVPAIFRGEEVSPGTDGKVTPGMVNIFVHNTNNNQVYKVFDPEHPSTSTDRSENLNGSTYETITEVAPRAFATPTSVKWMKELKGIDGTYKYFKEWVKDATYTVPDTDGKKWYTSYWHEENLYQAPVSSSGPTADVENNMTFNWIELSEITDSHLDNIPHTSHLQLGSYVSGGADPIRDKINSMTNNGRVTFVAYLSSATEIDANDIKGTIVPCDVDGQYMTNGDNTITAANVSFRNSAVKVEQSLNEQDWTGYTYSIQFSFAKTDLYNNNGEIYDYLLLFLNNSNVTVKKWFVHY